MRPRHEAPEDGEFEGDADEVATSDPIRIPSSEDATIRPSHTGVNARSVEIWSITVPMIPRM